MSLDEHTSEATSMRAGWSAIAFFTLVGVVSGGEWPAFRGPHGNGVADETELPLKWSATENIAWKVPLPGPGASSPIVWGDRVFVTAFTGTRASEIVRHVLCFDRGTGAKRWQKDYAAPLPENDFAKQIRQHGLTTNTPATDGKRVFVYFGRGGLFALDLDGNPLWQADLGEGFNVYGSGASPLLDGDRVIINACAESRQLVALDQATGKMLWKSHIDGMCWSTPIVVEPAPGKKEVLLNSGGGLYGHDVETGKQLWNVDIVATYNGTTPVVKDDIAYVMNQGVGEKEFVAVRGGGRGDVSKSHVLWTQNVGAAYTSPLVVGDRLFFFGGQVHCLRARDGQVLNRVRLDGTQSIYGSPIVAGDRLLLFTRSNGAYIVSADDKLQVLAHNTLGDESAFNASPALVGGQIFVRSDQNLYCIGRK
jgi:outer membrane protein assembly factor BamB